MDNPVLIGVQDFTSGASGFAGETDKGGPVDNKGTVTPTGNYRSGRHRAGRLTIPLRTPFALTGSATDADGDTIFYSWEQNDAGGAVGHVAAVQREDERPALRDVPELGAGDRGGHAPLQLAAREPRDDEPDAGFPGSASRS